MVKHKLRKTTVSEFTESIKNAVENIIAGVVQVRWTSATEVVSSLIFHSAEGTIIYVVWRNELDSRPCRNVLKQSSSGCLTEALIDHTVWSKALIQLVSPIVKCHGKKI